MNPNITLLGQMLSFAILIWFTVKFIWPPLMKAIEERQQKIAEGLAAADNAQKNLAQAQDKVNEELKAARAKANEIIDLVRLTTICDIYAALIERRAYRAPMPAEQAFAIMWDMGDKLDADLLGAFEKLIVRKI